MKIRKMTAQFGALEGQALTLQDGLNILYARNESGKSTWCAFLRTMLYGLNTAQRAKAGITPDKTKYRPWSGTPMSGSMDVQAGDRPITIRRWTERANQPMQAFSATATGTETPIPGLTADAAGEVLTGVPQAVFERSAFIRQSGLELTAAPELERRINAIVSTGDETVSYSETDKKLRTWLRRRRSGKHGALPELEAELEVTRRRLDDIRQASSSVTALDAELEQAEARQKQLVADMEQARKRCRQETLAELAEVRAQLKQAEQAHSEAQSALEAADRALSDTPFGDMGPEEARRRADIDRKNATELAALAAKLPPLKIAYIPLALAVLAFVLAVFLPWHIECIGVACILTMLFIVMYIRLVSIKKTKQDTLADREKILTCYGVDDPDEIEPLLEQYRTLWTARERAGFRMEAAAEALATASERLSQTEASAPASLDFNDGDNDAARARHAVDACKERIATLKERRAAAAAQVDMLGDPMVLQSTLEAQKEHYDALLQQEQALELAIEALAQSDSELQQRFSPQLAKRAAEIFSELTGGRYDELTLARDLTAKARLSGDAVGWDADYLSAGAKDQLYLALRLAVCELALPGDDPCPIVLDDALVTFDQERMARALELLHQISQTRQVLLFTCHERESNYFINDPSVAKITVDR